MTVNPRNLILPSVVTCSIFLTTLSISINTELALPVAPQIEIINTEKDSSSIHLSSNFPDNIQQWKPIIESTAIETGLDANLIAAVMLQESSGNPQAYSASGAVGLMQVMPKDGVASGFICENNPCFINRPTINELLDPSFNIRYGSNYLAGLVKQKGSEREALFSYGPMDMEYEYADTVLSIYEYFR